MTSISIQSLESSSQDLMTHRGRARRMMLLLAITLILGFLDLVLTVQYLEVKGFEEANPVAAAVIGLGVHWLAVYKCALMALHAVGLWLLRRHRSAEVGAWVSAGILSSLLGVWAFTTIKLAN